MAQEMAHSWFSMQFLIWYGSLAGGVGGGLAGVIGAISGFLVMRGKGRRFILGAMWFFVVFGAANLIFGLIALIAGQPWFVNYGFLLIGVIFTVVPASLIPLTSRMYKQVEARKLDAASLRNS